MLKELRKKKAEMVTASQEILDRAAEERRDVLSDEENARFDQIHVEIEKISGSIRRWEAQEEQAREIEKTDGVKTREVKRSDREERAEEERTITRARTDADAQDVLRAWLLNGSPEKPNADMIRKAAAAKVDIASRNLSLSLGNRPPRNIVEARDYKRALSTDPLYPETGAYTVPESFARELEIALLQFGGMRQAATVFRTAGGEDMRHPTVNDTSNEGEILGDNAQVNTQDVAFSQVVFKSFKYSSKMILVPVELIQDNAVDLTSYLGQALGERIGRVTNKHFTVGNGSSQPEGIVGASTLGKAGAFAGAVTYDELVDLEHSVDPAYRNGAQFMFHDLTLAALKKIRDDEGRLIWNAGLATNAPDTILGYPYAINQNMAPIGGNGTKSILFGQIRKYWIRDVTGISLLRLDERFADYHQVAFLAFSRHDGRLLNAGTNPVKHFTNGAGS